MLLELGDSDWREHHVLRFKKPLAPLAPASSREADRSVAPSLPLLLPVHAADFMHARHALSCVCVRHLALQQLLVSLIAYDFLPDDLQSEP